MNGSRLLWTLDDETLVDNGLTTLFALQDKPLAKEKRAIWVRELADTGLPVGAVLQALVKLKAEEMSNLKFGTVVAAARRFVEPEQREVARCEACGGSGFIHMGDEEKRVYALRCRCENGDWKARDYAIWEGHDTQLSRQGHGLLIRLA